MHILEYENYEETKKHYDTDFSYILILARFRWIFRVCRCTGTVKRKLFM